MGNFSFIICSNKFPVYCSSSSPDGTTMIWILEHLKLSQRFFSFSSFLWILISSFCSSGMFISSFYSKLLIWVLVSFPSLLVPCIISFISLCTVFITSFILWNSLFCEHSDYHFVFYFFHIFYCCSSTVVFISPTTPPPPQLSPLSTLDPTPVWFSPCVLYRYSWKHFPFPPTIPSHLFSHYCQFVLNFNVSGYILIACLFCWLGFTYRWDHIDCQSFELCIW